MHKIRPTLAVTVAALALAIPAVAGTKGVSVKDDKFVSKSVTINKGSTVKWTWRGSNPHNVVFKSFQSKVQTKGTFSHKFTKKGTYSYRCTIHSGMTGKVIVQ